MDNLKKSNADNAELAKQIETMKADAESRKAEYEGKIAQLEIDNIVNVALSNAKAKNKRCSPCAIGFNRCKSEGRQN
ncbi:MAG: phage scaffolding protein [Veillonella parvula]